MQKRLINLVISVLLITLSIFTVGCEENTSNPILPPVSLPPVVQNVLINPNPITVSRETTEHFMASVNGSNDPPKTVTWSITGNKDTLTTIDSAGRLSVNVNETAQTITVFATSTYDTGKIGTATVNVFGNDIIDFGGISWSVLHRDVANNRALIISREIIEIREYHKHHYADPIENIKGLTWEDSDLRTYLNNDFFNQFSSAEQLRIQTTLVSNSPNPEYGISGGNNTNDKIFLLSIDEAEKYFPSFASRVARLNGSASWWWLRSPGYISTHASYVYDFGNIRLNGSSVNAKSGGVRPALWLNL